MSDNSWYEKGELPPAGIICEKSFTSTNDEWSKVFIIGNTINGRIAYEIIDCPKKEYIGEIRVSTGNYKVSGKWVGEAYAFRPIKTERERAIEEMLTHMDAEGHKDLAAQLYDAGYRKNES